MSVEYIRDYLRRSLLRLWTQIGREPENPIGVAATADISSALERFLRPPYQGAVSHEPPISAENEIAPTESPDEHWRIIQNGHSLAAELSPDHLRLAASLIVGTSPAIREALDAALRLATTAVPVLISGETGTGKELFARLIHQVSHLSDAPFVAVNCASVPDSLLFAELFGYVPDSACDSSLFGRLGQIEIADGGTLLLDEVGDLSLSAQAALLRFLDSGDVQKIGGSQAKKVNVRLICSTSADLEAKVFSGEFRKDLFYRIGLVPVHIPPLRERETDVPSLTEHFLAEFQLRHNRKFPERVTEDAIRCLMAYPWPGNIRELIFTLERAFLLCHDSVLDAMHLPPNVAAAGFMRSPALVARIADRLKDARPVLFKNRERWARFLATHGDEDVTTGEVVREFGLSEASARIRLMTLVTLGLLEATGTKKGRKYRLIIPPTS